MGGTSHGGAARQGRRCCGAVEECGGRGGARWPRCSPSRRRISTEGASNDQRRYGSARLRSTDGAAARGSAHGGYGGEGATRQPTRLNHHERMRVWSIRPERLGVRHMFFMWSLILGFGYYIIWICYFYPCKTGTTTFPAWVCSIMGAAIHIILVVGVMYKLPTNISLRRLLFLLVVGVLSTLMGVLLYSTRHVACLGWLGLVLAVLSSYCRRESLDFEEFNWTLFTTNIGLTVAGFLWLYHPNLCVAVEYKTTSYLISGARAIQVLMWLSPMIRGGMRKMEGREEADCEQFNFVLLQRPPRRTRTPRISLIRIER